MSKERLDYIYEKMVRSAKKVRRSSRLPVSRYGIGGSINWNEVRRDLRKAKPIEGLDGSERQEAIIGPLNEYIEQTHGLGISFQVISGGSTWTNPTRRSFLRSSRTRGSTSTSTSSCGSTTAGSR